MFHYSSLVYDYVLYNLHGGLRIPWPAAQLQPPRARLAGLPQAAVRAALGQHCAGPSCAVV